MEGHAELIYKDKIDSYKTSCTIPGMPFLASCWLILRPTGKFSELLSKTNQAQSLNIARDLRVDNNSIEESEPQFQSTTIEGTRRDSFFISDSKEEAGWELVEYPRRTGASRF